jgi:hypothetical protein
VDTATGVLHATVSGEIAADVGTLSNALNTVAFHGEIDPVWSAASTGYYTKIVADGRFATGTPVYVEFDPLWAAASNAYYTKAAANGLFATGTPVYVESDPRWAAASNSYYTKVTADSRFATGTPVYVERDLLWTSVSNQYLTTNAAAATYVKKSGDTVSLSAGGLTVGTTQLVVLANGNIGIGTASATNKLAVNGTISAREVIVTLNGWPDYVFDRDYRRMPLPEVEQFIQLNHHLPGMPTAREAVGAGIGVGDMQARLLQKVEELTLHMIDLKQENEQLKQRLAQLESRRP